MSKQIKIERTPNPGMLLNNKFYIDGAAYPGDVVVGYAEKHCPLRWVNIQDIDFVHVKLAEEVGKTENSYIPCHPPLLTSAIVAMKRKNGRFIIIAGSVPPTGDRIKAHVLNERELHKGKLVDSYLTLAKTLEKATALEMSQIGSLSQMAANVRKQQKEQLEKFKDL